MFVSVTAFHTFYREVLILSPITWNIAPPSFPYNVKSKGSDCFLKHRNPFKPPSCYGDPFLIFYFS